MKISGNITKISDTQFTFTPDSDLEINTKYKMVVKNNFRAIDGITLNEDFNSVFTTELIVHDPLAIVSTIPVDESTLVSVSNDVEVTFNNSINPDTVNINTVWLEEIKEDPLKIIYIIQVGRVEDGEDEDEDGYTTDLDGDYSSYNLIYSDE